jgi:hypothetical protein
MTKEKIVSIEIDLISAATIRQVLFDAQKGYSYEFPTERINKIREVIGLLDQKIEEQVKE